MTARWKKAHIHVHHNLNGKEYEKIQCNTPKLCAEAAALRKVSKL